MRLPILRLVVRAGRAVVSLLDAVSALCFAVELAVYGLAWTVTWPFATAARRSLALSRRITSGRAP